MSLPKIQNLFRLTRDADLRYAASGTAVLNIGLASSEKYKDKETQCFLDAVAFGKPAEIIAQYAGTKGTQIYLSGKLKTESWDDKNTGQKRSKQVMEIETFDFVSGQNTGNQPQQPQMQSGAQITQNHNQNQQTQAPQQYAPNDFDDSDIPF